MGMLDGLIGQVASQALGGGNNTQNGLGGLLSGALGSAMGGGQQQSGLGGLVSGALGSALGGQQVGGIDIGSVLGSVMGGGNAQSAGVMGFMPLILGWIQRSGGLSQAFEALNGAGLADIASSFMSSGVNQIVDPSIIGNLIGNEHVAQFAEKSGMDMDSVKSGVAAILPEVMNQLTPQGGLENEEEANSEIGSLMEQFSKFM